MQISIDILYFRWRWPVRASTEINFYPHPPLLSKAYLDVIRTWEWKTFTVLYEDNDIFNRITSLVEDAKDYGMLVDVKKLDASITGNYRYCHTITMNNFLIR